MINFAEGTFCIIRTYSAGVFAGNLKERIGREVLLENAIRIWYWNGAFTLSQLAVEGTKKPSDCNFAVPVKQIILTEVIEVIPCTPQAEKSIKGVESCRAK